MSTSLSPGMSLSPPSASTTPAGAAAGSPAEVPERIAEIVAAQQGDHAAFARLVKQHEAVVLRLARGLARRPEDAWDLYQETFTKLYTTLARFRFECSFATWVYRLATNACLDYLRRQRVRQELWMPLAEPERRPSAGVGPERELLSREIQSRVAGALAALPPRQRLVFELRHDQGLRLRLIAEILNTSEATVKNALFRATRKLRRELEDLMTGGNL
ncbi:MAG: RNA polymerase sigma factor [Terriglobales bacterium]